MAVKWRLGWPLPDNPFKRTREMRPFITREEMRKFGWPPYKHFKEPDMAGWQELEELDYELKRAEEAEWENRKNNSDKQAAFLKQVQDYIEEKDLDKEKRLRRRIREFFGFDIEPNEDGKFVLDKIEVCLPFRKDEEGLMIYLYPYEYDKKVGVSKKEELVGNIARLLTNFRLDWN